MLDHILTLTETTMDMKDFGTRFGISIVESRLEPEDVERNAQRERDLDAAQCRLCHVLTSLGLWRGHPDLNADNPALEHTIRELLNGFEGHGQCPYPEESQEKQCPRKQKPE